MLCVYVTSYLHMTSYKMRATAKHKNTEEKTEHVGIQAFSKKCASGKGKLVCKKSRQILFNLLMRQSKEKKGLFNQR